ncbi:MAG: 50S ribosomal protein L29 [Vicinamibacterales bacterium]|jgi:large subunit ribosomal protein L29|nr:50S ribosomal protein L29 [Acidobacteriota bacterium]MDP7211835.1 50S ribosomal protein L29 [Vicinamibacterales bacterium]HJO17487.1 50S ribosomal protein L29 [Vicinamibacterales bacterium]
MTKIADFRELTDEDLRHRERDLDEQVFRLRIQKGMGQLDSSFTLRETRRDLARVKTLLRENERNQEITTRSTDEVVGE